MILIKFFVMIFGALVVEAATPLCHVDCDGAQLANQVAMVDQFGGIRGTVAADSCWVPDAFRSEGYNLRAEFEDDTGLAVQVIACADQDNRLFCAVKELCPQCEENLFCTADYTNAFGQKSEKILFLRSKGNLWRLRYHDAQMEHTHTLKFEPAHRRLTYHKPCCGTVWNFLKNVDLKGQLGRSTVVKGPAHFYVVNVSISINGVGVYCDKSGNPGSKFMIENIPWSQVRMRASMQGTDGAAISAESIFHKVFPELIHYTKSAVCCNAVHSTVGVAYVHKKSNHSIWTMFDSCMRVTSVEYMRDFVSLGRVLSREEPYSVVGGRCKTLTLEHASQGVVSMGFDGSAINVLEQGACMSHRICDADRVDVSNVCVLFNHEAGPHFRLTGQLHYAISLDWEKSHDRLCVKLCNQYIRSDKLTLFMLPTPLALLGKHISYYVGGMKNNPTLNRLFVEDGSLDMELWDGRFISQNGNFQYSVAVTPSDMNVSQHNRSRMIAYDFSASDMREHFWLFRIELTCRVGKESALCIAQNGGESVCYDIACDDYTRIFVQRDLKTNSASVVLSPNTEETIILNVYPHLDAMNPPTQGQCWHLRHVICGDTAQAGKFDIPIVPFESC